jgi:hypothetical protein
MSKKFSDWWNDYLWLSAKEPGRRLLEKHANFLWKVHQGSVRRLSPKNRVLCSGEPPEAEFYDRSMVNACVAKGLLNFESLALGQAAVDMFSAVERYASARYLDLPDDAPRPFVNRKPGRPSGKFSKIWRSVPSDLRAELSRALCPHLVQLKYQSSPGFVSVARSYKDRDSGNEYSEFTHEARFYFNNLKWRVLTTDNQNTAGLAVDVLRAAFNPMMSLQRTHRIIQADRLNTSPEALRAALASPDVQVVLKKLQLLFLPSGSVETCLTFSYDPNVAVSATKLDRILELEAENAGSKSEVARLTKLLAAANVSA